MRFLLDTNSVSDVIKHPDGRVADMIRLRGETNVCTSIIVAAELRYGAAKRQSVRLNVQMDKVLRTMTVLPFESPAEHEYGRIRAHLQQTGKPISANDLFIAAHALALDCILVTDNTREFERVPGLRCENWLR